MFQKIKERLTYFFTSLALLNLSAFSGFLMAEVEEVVVTGTLLRADSSNIRPIEVITEKDW